VFPSSSASRRAVPSLIVFAHLAAQPGVEVAYWVEQMRHARILRYLLHVLWSWLLAKHPCSLGPAGANCILMIRDRVLRKISSNHDLSTTIVEYAADIRRPNCACQQYFFCDVHTACSASILHIDPCVVPDADTDTFCVRPRHRACHV
jgi:hypothetical protein